MALGRPADAVEAYQAALGFDQYSGRGKALSNLGQAYCALGDDAEAVKAFEKATQLHGYTLSPTAQAAYEGALARSRPAPRQVVEGWQTGEVPQVIAASAATEWTPDFADEPVNETELAEPAQSGSPYDVAAEHDFEGLPPEADHAAAELGVGDEAAIADFFTVTEDELKERDRDARREGRSHGGKRRSVGKTIVIIAVAGRVGRQRCSAGRMPSDSASRPSNRPSRGCWPRRPRVTPSRATGWRFPRRTSPRRWPRSRRSSHSTSMG